MNLYFRNFSDCCPRIFSRAFARGKMLKFAHEKPKREALYTVVAAAAAVMVVAVHSGSKQLRIET